MSKPEVMSLNELLKYSECPNKYRFVYGSDKFPPIKLNKIKDTNYWEHCLRTAINNLLFNFQGDKKVSSTAFLNKFTSMWMKPPKEIDFGKTRTHKQLYDSGFKILQNTFLTLSEIKMTIISISFPIIIVNSHIPYKIVIDCIAKIDNKLTLIEINTDKMYSEDYQKTNLKPILYQSAYRYHMEQEEDRHIIFNINKNKIDEVEYKSIKEQQKALLYLNKIYNCIKMDNYYPRQSYECMGCGYREYCNSPESAFPIIF